MRTHHGGRGALLKAGFAALLAASFGGALYVRFWSGLITVPEQPYFPAYAACALSSVVVWVVVWALLDWHLDLSTSLVFTPVLGRWLFCFFAANAATLALISLGAFFWREHSFSMLTVGLAWLFFSLSGGLLALVLRRRPDESLPRRRCEVWLTSDAAGLEDVRAQFADLGGSAVFRRFPSPEAALRALKKVRESGVAEIHIALGSEQSESFAVLFDAMRQLELPGGILAPSAGRTALEPMGSFVQVPTAVDRVDTFHYQITKRLLDLAAALLLAVLCSPLLLALAISIALTAGGPIFVRQERLGRSGRRFGLLKFRTLPAEALRRADREWSVEPASRWTGFLRDTGLDELPQLFNVIRGEMSLVGPRPERPFFATLFEKEWPFYGLRHRLEAGLTGWAQIHGWRGDTSIARRLEYDLYYLKHWSLGLDVWILFQTGLLFARNIVSCSLRGEASRDAGAG